jgi:hypothetical protein
VLNLVITAWNFNTSTTPRQFGERLLYKAERSIDHYGFRQPMIIESKGTKSTSSNDKAVLARWQEQVDNIFKRYADPPPILKVAVFYRKHTWEVGDCIKVTYDKLPNLKFGVRGWVNEICEIIDLKVGWGVQGRLELTLLHTGAISIPPAAARTQVARTGRRGVAIVPPAPGGLRIVNVTGNTFTGRTIKLAWHALAIRADDRDRLAAHPEFITGYVVSVYNSPASAIIRKSYAAAAASQPMWEYTFERNGEDFGTPALPQPQRSVKFSVRARTLYGLEGDPAFITVKNPAPSMANVLPTVKQRPAGLVISWPSYRVKDTDFDQYSVRVSAVNNPPLESEEVSVAARTARSATIADQPTGTTLFIQVVPYDGFGPGTASQVKTFATSTTPSNVTIATTPSGIRLKWTRITDANFEAVEVYRAAGVNDRASATLVEDDAGRTGYVDFNEDLVSGETYYYWVRTRSSTDPPTFSPYHTGDTNGLLGIAPVIGGYQRVGTGTPFATGQGPNGFTAVAVDTVDNELDILQVNGSTFDIWWGESTLAGKQATAQASKITGTFGVPAVVFDGSDLQMIVLEDNGAGSNNLRYARFSGGGTLESGPTTLESTVGGTSTLGLDWDGGSNLFAVWATASLLGVRLARLNLTGAIQGSVLTLWTEASFLLVSLAVAVDDSGNLHITYSLFDGGTLTYHMRYRKYSQTGTLLVGPIVLNGGNTNIAYAVLCRMTTTKHIIAIFSNFTGSIDAGLMLARLTRAGTVQIHPRQILVLDHWAPNMAVAMDRRNDNLYAVYENNTTNAVKMERFERVDA